MLDYMNANRDLWNELTPIHARSAFYDVEGFKRGRITLMSIEREELGDVAGKTLLHLQCHFGMDTLSWARLGASVTGVDFSEEAIALAQSLSQELGIAARFLHTNLYDLPDVLAEQFDIVFTSYGALCWLPDLEAWGHLIGRYLKPGGTFYIVEGHPFMMPFDDGKASDDYRVSLPYFQGPEPLKFEGDGDYADPSARVTHPAYEWNHSLGTIISALAGAGLRIEFLHEFPVCAWKAFPFLEESADGWWRVRDGMIPIPMTFSIKATRA
ncbi:MAG TPA: class I SAM-dependent methyltransferase [Ktedonobacterales bacterium]|jgi:SAM-dependent methyltransferase